MISYAICHISDEIWHMAYFFHENDFANALITRLALLDRLAIRLLICLLLVIVYRLVAQG